jgi:Pyruvate/2-oxoacid:ferredoxin oxidoreductase delta subunit
MAHRKQGFRFEDDWDKHYLQNHLNGWKQAITLPVNLEIKAEHQVLSIESAREILEKSDLIVRMECVCRTSQKNCDAPTNNCLSLNDRAKMILNNKLYEERNPRQVEVDETLELLKDSHNAGLVHMAYAVNNQEINELCSCCSCCCVALSATLRYGLYPHLLTAVMIEETDSTKCINCSLCVDRCQFGARKMTHNGLEIDNSLCFGCGLCISHCPTNAISLKNIS